jgi:hypothetical protein
MHRLGRRVLHAGLVVEALGLLGIYAAFRGAGTGIGSLDLLAPMIVGGIGMGMVFVPLFDIAIADVEPHEIGSASAVLQSVNGLSMSLGVAGLGAIFFGIVDTHIGPAHGFLRAAEWTTLISAGLLAAAFAIACWLPRHARPMPGSEAAPAIEPVPAAA